MCGKGYKYDILLAHVATFSHLEKLKPVITLSFFNKFLSSSITKVKNKFFKKKKKKKKER